jgi:hypothetical protein
MRALGGRGFLSYTNTSELSAAAFPKHWNIAWIGPYACVGGVYLIATWLTRPFFQGDTRDYVDSIVRRIGGEYFEFWEFGHVAWRPLGWMAFRVSNGFLSRFVSTDPRVQVTAVLIAMSWLAGLMSALLLLALLRLYCSRRWIPQLIVASFIFSNAELNYSQTGSSYVPGLSLLILGMYIIAREARRPTNSIGAQVWAGLALAGSVSLWFLYILAVPAAIVLPFASGSPDKNRFRLSVGTLFFFCFSTALAFSAVIIHLQLLSAAEVLAWIHESSHGVTIGGVSRSIFGWARSFLSLDDAGRIIKRYLVHDPFNPISSRDLIHAGPQLLKFVLFYMTLLAMIVNLRRFSHGRKALIVATVATMPVLGFAIHWSGGDLERYLPLYPAFFLALAISLNELKALSWRKAIAWTFVLCVVVTNAVSLRSAVAQQSQTQAENRVSDLLPRLNHGSLVVVSHNLDDLMEFTRNFPFSRINRSGSLNLYPLLTPGNSDVVSWRESFASRTLDTWRIGGDVWISKRLFHPVPQADWNWVEGDDNRVAWSDWNPYFSHFRYGQNLGGDDGFALLLHSTENQNLLAVLTRKSNLLLASEPR